VRKEKNKSNDNAFSQTRDDPKLRTGEYDNLND
jgi:hypothetical protein